MARVPGEAQLRQVDLRWDVRPEESARRQIASLRSDELVEFLLPERCELRAESALRLEGLGESRTLLVGCGELPPLLTLIGLEPPEPLERVLETLAALAPGERLLAELPHRPAPLLAVLAKLGATFEVLERPDGSALVCVTK
ncbi:MAG: DUF2249 domain-containing protein [Deltaproteobacteria bacterium]|nr:DUF2249 domain-containing protein [Deltaproteobacteria bacterium]